MAAIAAEAGVALKTVYLAFETKSGLLRALWHLRLRGDEADAPVAERQWYRDVIAEPDPERQLRLNARNARAGQAARREAHARHARRAPAPTPDIAALWQRIQDDFYANQRSIVDALDAKGALAPGLDAARAADILWTLNHPDVWHLLVGERGWTPERLRAAGSPTRPARSCSGAEAPQPARTGSSACSLTSVSASSAAGSESRTTPTPA